MRRIAEKLGSLPKNKPKKWPNWNENQSLMNPNYAKTFGYNSILSLLLINVRNEMFLYILHTSYYKGIVTIYRNSTG